MRAAGSCGRRDWKGLVDRCVGVQVSQRCHRRDRLFDRLNHRTAVRGLIDRQALAFRT